MKNSRQASLEVDQSFSDVADDRGVNPALHTGLGHGMIGLAAREDALETTGATGTTAAEPELSEAEEKEIDRLVDAGRHNYEGARSQVLSGRR